ncbi:hypothetical protein V1264_004192 [Littorina saxatilis]|uniref:Beta-lactamase-related domain-containing protein n=1 Tax=Littorina saxatilis TaxID=31220 RepID=A0AAN9B1J3_9CAEN
MPSFLSLWVILGAIGLLSPGSSAVKGQNAIESVPAKQRDLSNVFSGDQIRRVPSAEKYAIRDPHSEQRQVDKLHIEPGQKSKPKGPQQLKKRLMEDFTMAKQKCVDILKRAAIQKQEKKAAQNTEKKTDEDCNRQANILETRESQREEKKVVQQLKEKATEDFIKAVMTCKDVPGLAVAVVSDGDSWTKGFGVQDLVKKTPVDTKTHFAIGSLTKAFTSALLAVALQEANKKGQKVTWQSTAGSIIGEDFKLTKRLEQNVTLEDLLSHRTGLMAADIMAVAGFPPYSRSQFISRLHFLPAVVAFRKHFHYNNWMYSLAGDISEHLLQNSWEVSVS